MRTRPIALCIIFGFTLTACDGESPKGVGAVTGARLFTERAPVADSVKTEISYLKRTGQLKPQELLRLEKAISDSHRQFGVPQALLWCLFFQESRFDLYKDAFREYAARGLGQFTRSALDEINEDTNHYVPGTGQKLTEIVKPKKLPISFKMVSVKRPESLENRRRRVVPEQPKNSYFQTETAVAASAVYINNRHHQIKRAIEKRGFKYNADVVWLFSAAAYNKGPRAVLAILSDMRAKHGDKKLVDLLDDPLKVHELLQNEDLLNGSLKKIWKKRRRLAYVEELKRNMDAIGSCSFSREK